jgi:lipoteichoic acid synthase
MQSNAKIGKSSDGQLIYMTGLLPLRSGITVSYAKEDSLVGLPQLLINNRIVKHTQVLVPTSPSFWEQSSMNQVYGFQKMYAKYDDEENYDGEDLVDEKMFDFARKLDSRLPSSSFSMLVTLSMHEPYDSPIEHGFSLSDEKLPLRFRNYLVACHYFDQQIGKYIDHLKTVGLYDNSLIVITADHNINPVFIGVEGDKYERLPLYIINGNIDSSTAWTGDCNQLDVYTTILDIFGVDCEWRGLGHTLLTQDYVNSVTEKTWKISEWIILGDFFRKQ